MSTKCQQVGLSDNSLLFKAMKFIFNPWFYVVYLNVLSLLFDRYFLLLL